MTIIELEEVRIEPWSDAAAVPDLDGVGYERIDAIAHYVVDPELPGNERITDLALAPRDEDGLVHFRGDFTMLRPVDELHSNGICLLDVPNRGRRVATTLFNRADIDLSGSGRIPVGDGWLFRHGYTVAWVGWQWDVPRGPSRMGQEPPSVAGRVDDGVEIQLRIQLATATHRVPLTDQHVGPVGEHVPIPTADVSDPNARMLVRDRLHGEPTELDRGSWWFPDPDGVCVDGDFVPGRIYDLIYRTNEVPVVGAGLLAVRDMAAFLRSDHPDNPEASRDLKVVVTGISQNSRFLRHLLHLGLDRNEAGERVVDGVLGIVGGARRGQFNQRGGQPSVQPTLDFGHLFPFADLPLPDPQTGVEAGLLDRVAAHDDPPKVMWCDASAEYWRGDAALAHTSLGTDGPAADVDDADFVRRYLFSGTQHSVGETALTDLTPFGSRGSNPVNFIDYRPLYRASLANLVDWMLHGTEPPPSEVPRISDGTAVRRQTVLDDLSALGAIALPELDELAYMSAIDLGDRTAEGIGRYPAEVIGGPYPDWVSAVDADGNEIAGIAMPDVSVPIATHLGYNPRHPTTGAPGQIIEYSGSTVPFARTEAERDASGDARPSIEDRYADREDYLAQVRTAAENLVAQRHLLADDVETCVEIAAERWALIVV